MIPSGRAPGSNPTGLKHRRRSSGFASGPDLPSSEQHTLGGSPTSIARRLSGQPMRCRSFFFFFFFLLFFSPPPLYFFLSWWRARQLSKLMAVWWATRTSSKTSAMIKSVSFLTSAVTGVVVNCVRPPAAAIKYCFAPVVCRPSFFLLFLSFFLLYFTVCLCIEYIRV